ncbi:Histone acetyltransferase mst2 [Wickerhamiella sorbophila]|uniref:Histone acetyltransferase n=1 Tax=Wickerhamiella sorbophila TaxID=45607 RepID=A0A2T0FMF0_9ASCO|nr:Histone acetyltransferase mst2 [Wickerhamiella sorbophila]PRT56168.1 Histone acetyltransferase mst2 [Wickerhamiella sorbophila]
MARKRKGRPPKRGGGGSYANERANLREERVDAPKISISRSDLVNSDSSSDDEFFSSHESPQDTHVNGRSWLESTRNEPTPVPDINRLQLAAGTLVPRKYGDTEPPFCGLFAEKDANVSLGIPTATERYLFNRFSKVAEPIATEYDPERTQSVSRITRLHISGRSIPTWYTAPYPEEYTKRSYISVCDMCLKYMKSDFVAHRHSLKCPGRAPPGTEIYRDSGYSVFEIDGAHAPLYCQRLCLMAKLFLDSKALYYDVEPFLFYVLTSVDETGCHFIGYFSKLKISSDFPAKDKANNVSCIVTLPGLQQKGFGQFLISLSYFLTRAQHTTGTPEKPLSELGAKAYTKFWTLHICEELELIHAEKTRKISIQELSMRTGMTTDDVIYSLETLGWFKNGQISVNITELHHRLKTWRSKDLLKVNPQALLWTPLKLQSQNLDS